MSAVAIAESQLESTYARIMPRRGPVLIAVDFIRPLAGERVLVQVAGSDERLSVTYDQLRCGRTGYCLSAWLEEHQRELSPLYGWRYSAKVKIAGIICEVRAAAITAV